MMEFSDFYDIAEYGNEHWNGNYTPKEIACNAYDYMRDFEWSKKAFVTDGEIAGTIRELTKLLSQDGSEEAKHWLYQIADELGLIDMDCGDYLETDECLKEFM